jgi:hypothetical protein
VAKVDLRDTLKKLERIRKQAFNNNFKRQLALLGVRNVRGRTASGQQLSRLPNPRRQDDHRGQTTRRMKPLSQSYKDQRKGLVAFYTDDQKRIRVIKPGSGRLQLPFTPGEFFSPNRSNLTASGQLLNAFEYRVTSKGFTIFINRNRRRGSRLSNDQVREFVEEQGRYFLGFSEAEFRVLQERAIDRLRASARQILRR